MCVNETYSKVQVGKQLSDMFCIKNGLRQGDTLLPLLVKSALEYIIRGIQVNQDGLKLNVTHQLLVYTDDVDILGGSIHTLKKNRDSLVVTSMEMGLKVNVDKAKDMVICRDQKAGRNHSIKTI
jgi:hypothetical protein